MYVEETTWGSEMFGTRESCSTFPWSLPLIQQYSSFPITKDRMNIMLKTKQWIRCQDPVKQNQRQAGPHNPVCTGARSTESSGCCSYTLLLSTLFTSSKSCLLQNFSRLTHLSVYSLFSKQGFSVCPGTCSIHQASLKLKRSRAFASWVLD